MPQPTDGGRVHDRPDVLANFRIEPGPDNTAVLVLLTPGAPCVILERRFSLDPFMAYALRTAMNRELAHIPRPGLRPDAAVFDAADRGDSAALLAAADACNALVWNLWSDGGSA
jgi:hypothetical protein